MVGNPTSDILDAKYVRVRNRRPNGLIEFDFAIGAPEIFVELLMPVAEFDEFCATNRVIDVTGQALEQNDFEVRLARVLAGDAR
jgi:phenol hydroxylase P0 protein